MPFDTPLSPPDEVAFQQWFAKNKQSGAIHPQDTGEDYDLRGAFKAGVTPGADAHWPDTFKKPNHPTFSDESIYSSLVGTRPGSWQADKYIPFSMGQPSMPEPKGPTSSNYLNSIIGDGKAAWHNGPIDTALYPIEAAQKTIEYGMNNAAEGLHQLVSPTKKGFQWYKSGFDRPEAAQDGTLQERARQEKAKQPGMGYNEQPNSFWKALEGVINGLRLSSNQPAPWGMHEPTLTAAQSVGPALQGAGDVMSDPRNAWMGMGPVAGMALMGKGIRGAGKFEPEMGGFNQPVSEMRRAMDAPRPNLRRGEVPGGDTQAVREGYLGNINGMNQIANFRVTDPESAQRLSSTLNPMGNQTVESIQRGLEALETEKLLRSINSSGGSTPPFWVEPLAKRLNLGYGQYPNFDVPYQGIPRKDHYNKPQ